MKLGNVLKALLEVGLHSRRVLGLGEDLEELIIREEVETWEGNALGLQVLTQPLLDLLQQEVALAKVLQEPVVSTVGNDFGVSLGPRHNLPPYPVHGLVALAFHRELHHDVL